MEKKFYRYKFTNFRGKYDYLNEYSYFKVSKKELDFAKWFMKTIVGFVNTYAWYNIDLRRWVDYCNYYDRFIDNIEEISESEIKNKNIDIKIFDEYKYPLSEEGEKYIYCSNTYFEGAVIGYDPDQCYFELTESEADFINWFLGATHALYEKRIEKLHYCRVIKSREKVSFKTRSAM